MSEKEKSETVQRVYNSLDKLTNLFYQIEDDFVSSTAQDINYDSSTPLSEIVADNISLFGESKIESLKKIVKTRLAIDLQVLKMVEAFEIISKSDDYKEELNQLFKSNCFDISDLETFDCECIKTDEIDGPKLISPKYILNARGENC